MVCKDYIERVDCTYFSIIVRVKRKLFGVDFTYYSGEWSVYIKVGIVDFTLLNKVIYINILLGITISVS